MLSLKVLCILLVFDVTLALPQIYTKADVENIHGIVAETIENSPLPRPLEEQDEIYKWAGIVYECMKSKGIVKINSGAKTTSSRDKTPFAYRGEKNTDGEKDVPTWDISLSDFDRIFDSDRYSRYLSWVKYPSFKRRITWLFPDWGMFEI